VWTVRNRLPSTLLGTGQLPRGSPLIFRLPWTIMRSFAIPNIKLVQRCRRVIIGCSRHAIIRNGHRCRASAVVQLAIAALMNSRERRLDAAGIAGEIASSRRLWETRYLLV